MSWPPLKAWTSNESIDGQIHFVAINYGGRRGERWVILMSVLDSDNVIKISWSNLNDSCKWECGWYENKSSRFSKLNNRIEIKNTKCTIPSTDSGLTIPITKDSIRPWFKCI